jgi:hypothetical protein
VGPWGFSTPTLGLSALARISNPEGPIGRLFIYGKCCPFFIDYKI